MINVELRKRIFTNQPIQAGDKAKLRGSSQEGIVKEVFDMGYFTVMQATIDFDGVEKTFDLIDIKKL